MESSLNSITLPQSGPDQVIVVMLLCQFKYGFTAFKIVAGDDTSVVKLVQYAIYRSQTNFFTHIDQTFV